MWEDCIWTGRSERIRGGEVEAIVFKVKDGQYRAGAQTWSDDNKKNWNEGPTQRWLKRDYTTAESAIQASSRFVKKITPILKKGNERSSAMERVNRLFERPVSGSSRKVKSQSRSRGIDR
jgi:hypothetical protein